MKPRKIKDLLTKYDRGDVKSIEPNRLEWLRANIKLLRQVVAGKLKACKVPKPVAQPRARKESKTERKQKAVDLKILKTIVVERRKMRVTSVQTKGLVHGFKRKYEGFMVDTGDRASVLVKNNNRYGLLNTFPEDDRRKPKAKPLGAMVSVAQVKSNAAARIRRERVEKKELEAQRAQPSQQSTLRPSAIRKLISQSRYSDVTVNGEKAEGNRNGFRFSGHLSLIRIDEAMSASSEAFARIWDLQDGMAGLPAEMYDWSAIRDSSKEALAAMNKVATEYIPDHLLFKVLGVTPKN